VRYAAVLYSIRDIRQVFTVRHRLLVAAHGTTMAAALCGYRRELGDYPDDLKKTYGLFARERSDADSFDKDYGRFCYRRLGSRTAVDTRIGRLWLEAGQGLLYSRGQNFEDDRGAEYTPDGAEGDIILWPPLRVIARQEGLLP
ncbi:MAG: hypothetical protein ACYTG1_13170, partial [Planctomycetota bacterium]